ncbi:glycosyltransferase family 2 protein [Candidatus Woesebacteria bacterium]|nr:glycosyltransferase family 2 protein [Candidatus Woesebacteria bacterium]
MLKIIKIQIEFCDILHKDMSILKPSISIAIPTYNEEENLEWVIKDTLRSLPKYFKDYEVIIVDDGSSDKTGEIADKLVKKNSKLRVIHQPNSGYSKAMLSGIKAAKKDFVAYMPADGQFLIKDMRHCFEVLKDSDLILGYRGGRSDYTTRRIIFSYGYLLLLLLLFDIKYMDVGWVNIWRTKKVQKIKLRDVGGIFILTEILVRFKNLGYKIVEAPSYYRPRRAGEVKNAKLKVAAQTFLNAWKLWIEMNIK